MLSHSSYGGSSARLHDALLDPGSQAAVELLVAEPPAANREQQFGERARRALDPGRAQLGAAGRPPIERLVADDHPSVHRLQPRRSTCRPPLRRGQPGVDESTEVGEVAASPVWLPLRRADASWIDRPERVRHDGPPEGGGAAPTVVVGWKVDRSHAGHLGTQGWPGPVLSLDIGWCSHTCPDDFKAVVEVVTDHLSD